MCTFLRVTSRTWINYDANASCMTRMRGLKVVRVASTTEIGEEHERKGTHYHANASVVAMVYLTRMRRSSCLSVDSCEKSEKILHKYPIQAGKIKREKSKNFGNTPPRKIMLIRADHTRNVLQ